MTKLSFTALLLIFGLHSKAQDPVDVKKEPVHVTVFKNKLVTVMYPRLLPGDTSFFHIHQTPSVFLIMTNTKVYDELYGRKGIDTVNVKGRTWYSNFEEKKIHRVGNIDTVEFRAIDIEITNAPKTKEANFINGLDLPADFDRARIYPLKLSANSTLDLKLTSNPVLIISYQGDMFIREKSKTDLLRQGDIKWVEGSTALRLMNSGTEPAEGYIYEIKK